jgi:hypothetical protein
MGAYEKDSAMSRLFRAVAEIAHSTDAAFSELINVQLDGDVLYYLTKEGNRVDLDITVDYKSLLRLKLCIAEVMLKRACDEVLEFIISLPNPGDRDELLAIFWILLLIARKHRKLDAKILEKCRVYFQVDYLRSPVSHILTIFTKQRPELVMEVFGSADICYMNLWFPEHLRKANEDTVKCFLDSINSRGFKRSKRAFKNMDAELFSKLPGTYTTMGYCHLRELFKDMPVSKLEEIKDTVNPLVRLFLPIRIDNIDTSWFVHRDDEVRVEAFKHIADANTVRRFLMVNQFNYDFASLNLLVSYFEAFVQNSVRKELCSVYDDIVSGMIRSRNMARRHFGARLVDIFLRYGVIQSKSWSHLLFDKVHEIRSCMKKHACTLELSDEALMKKILSYESYEIEGATNYVMARESMIADRCKREFDTRLQHFVRADDGKIVTFPIYGLVHLLSRVGKYDIADSIEIIFDYCFKKLSGVAHFGDDLDSNLAVHWRNLRECCYFYYLNVLHMGRYKYIDKLLISLIQVSHLGVILAISEHLLEIFDRLELRAEQLKEIADVCLKHIRECKLSSRDSGGLSTVFLALFRSRKHFREIFSYVTESVFGLIEDGDGDTKLHSLNILQKVAENSRLYDALSLPRLLQIAFSALGFELWPIRNAGSRIFSRIVMRTFRSQSETSFVLYSDLRSMLYKQMLSFLEKESELGLFSVLCIYEGISLTEKESRAVESCARMEGLLGLKAKNVLRSKAYVAKSIRLCLRFTTEVPEEERLCKLLLLLDAASEEERMIASRYITEMYGPWSLEYQKHIVVKRLCKMDAVEKATKLLREFHDSMLISSSSVFGSTPSYECFDFEYILSLFGYYKTPSQ